jgi:hypothetical protein
VGDHHGGGILRLRPQRRRDRKCRHTLRESDGFADPRRLARTEREAELPEQLQSGIGI